MQRIIVKQTDVDTFYVGINTPYPEASRLWENAIVWADSLELSEADYIEPQMCFNDEEENRLRMATETFFNLYINGTEALRVALNYLREVSN